MRVTVIYELTNPTDAHAYKCSQRAVEACYMLECIAADMEEYLMYKATSEAVLIDIKRMLEDWNKSNAS